MPRLFFFIPGKSKSSSLLRSGQDLRDLECDIIRLILYVGMPFPKKIVNHQLTLAFPPVNSAPAPCSNPASGKRSGIPGGPENFQ